jgi:hypothetical protein
MHIYVTYKILLSIIWKIMGFYAHITKYKPRPAPTCTEFMLSAKGANSDVP